MEAGQLIIDVQQSIDILKNYKRLTRKLFLKRSEPKHYFKDVRNSELQAAIKK